MRSEPLKVRREALDELQKGEIASQGSLSTDEAEQAVTDYGAEAAQNLENFTDVQWQGLLRTVILESIFYGDGIRINGRIPVGSGPGPQLLLDSSLRTPGSGALLASQTRA